MRLPTLQQAWQNRTWGGVLRSFRWKDQRLKSNLIFVGNVNWTAKLCTKRTILWHQLFCRGRDVMRRGRNQGLAKQRRTVYLKGSWGKFVAEPSKYHQNEELCESSAVSVTALFMITIKSQVSHNVRDHVRACHVWVPPSYWLDYWQCVGGKSECGLALYIWGWGSQGVSTLKTA